MSLEGCNTGPCFRWSTLLGVENISMLAKLSVSLKQKMNATKVIYELSWDFGGQATLRKILMLDWRCAMYVKVKLYVTLCEQRGKRSLPLYNEDLNVGSVSRLKLWVRMDISYMHKGEDRYHQLVTDEHYLSRLAGDQRIHLGTWEWVADLFVKAVICRFGIFG